MGVPVVRGEAGAVQEHPGAGRGPGGADDHPRVVHLVGRLGLLRVHDVVDRRWLVRPWSVVVVDHGSHRGRPSCPSTGAKPSSPSPSGGALVVGVFGGCRRTPASSRPSPLLPQPVATTIAATPIPILHHRRFPPIVLLLSTPLTPGGRSPRGVGCVTVLQLVLAPPIRYGRAGEPTRRHHPASPPPPGPCSSGSPASATSWATRPGTPRSRWSTWRWRSCRWCSRWPSGGWRRETGGAHGTGSTRRRRDSARRDDRQRRLRAPATGSWSATGARGRSGRWTTSCGRRLTASGGWWLRPRRWPTSCRPSTTSTGWW